MKRPLLLLVALVAKTHAVHLYNYTTLVKSMIEQYHGHCRLTHTDSTVVQCEDHDSDANLLATSGTNPVLQTLVVCDHFVGYRQCRSYDLVSNLVDLGTTIAMEFTDTTETVYSNIVARLLQQFEGECIISMDGDSTQVSCEAVSVAAKLFASGTVDQTPQQLQMCQRNAVSCDIYGFGSRSSDDVLRLALGLDYLDLYSALMMTFFEGQCRYSIGNGQTFVDCSTPTSTGRLVANGIDDPNPASLSICNQKGATQTCTVYDFALMRVDDLRGLAFLSPTRSSLPEHFQQVMKDMNIYFNGKCVQTRGEVRIILTCTNSNIQAVLSTQPDPGQTIPIVRRLRVCLHPPPSCGVPFLFTSAQESFATALAAARP